MATDRYESPLIVRYSQDEMQRLFSDDKKFYTWRLLWTEVAKALQFLKVPGITITDAQIEEMQAHLTLTEDDYAYAAQVESEVFHDVIAHIRAFARVCPGAASIIHLGETSCDQTDNTDLIIVREALVIVEEELARVIDPLSRFADKYKYVPTLGFTHLQPAALTTVGKRATLWLADLLRSLNDVRRVRQGLRFRGVKGAVGTQASFLALFKCDHEKVEALDQMMSKRFGFESALTVTGQTYTRKVDTEVLEALAGIGSSAHKMCTDIRLLQFMGEVKEPFGKNQLGSSAMSHKRNPMRSERVCAISRFLVGLPQMASYTHALQWLERTLDDSAGRRIYIPEAFLAADSVLTLLRNITEGLVIYPGVIYRNMKKEFPFMTMEKILVAMVEAGANRQECHERLRDAAVQISREVEQGENNYLIERLLKDPYFAPILDDVCNFGMFDQNNFIGRAPQQVERFLREEVAPALAPYKNVLGVENTSDLKV